jgi:hypothetical protein
MFLTFLTSLLPHLHRIFDSARTTNKYLSDLLRYTRAISELLTQGAQPANIPVSVQLPATNVLQQPPPTPVILPTQGAATTLPQSISLNSTVPLAQSFNSASQSLYSTTTSSASPPQSFSNSATVPQPVNYSTVPVSTQSTSTSNSTSTFNPTPTSNLTSTSNPTSTANSTKPSSQSSNQVAGASSPSSATVSPSSINLDVRLHFTSHLLTSTPSHLHTFTPSHLLTSTLSHLHTFTPSHLHTFTPHLPHVHTPLVLHILLS